MKLHKEDTRQYEPFVETLLQRSYGKGYKQKAAMQSAQHSNHQGDIGEKYLGYFQSLYSFEKRIQLYNSVKEVIYAFNTTLSKFVDSKDTAIFFFNEDKSKLMPIADLVSQETIEFIDRAFGNGLLSVAFETGKLTIVQSSKKDPRDNKTENHIIIPIPENKEYRGALSILTTIPSFKDRVLEFQLINIMLRMTVNKIDSLALKNNLINTVEELHNYQSKLSNDYKYSAIGELTFGVVEHIFSPLQVILSSADLLRNSVPESDLDVIDNIKEQIEKVKSIIQPLVKFAQSGSTKPILEACCINDFIEDYYNVVNSSLKQINYECILDLDEKLSTIVCNANELNQLLTNIFTLLQSEPQNCGGILVQTRQQNDQIIFKLISTDYLPLLIDYENNPTRDLSLIMVSRFINKLEGKLIMDTSPGGGSTITIVFPLKRNMQ